MEKLNEHYSLHKLLKYKNIAAELRDDNCEEFYKAYELNKKNYYFYLPELEYLQRLFEQVELCIPPFKTSRYNKERPEIQTGQRATRYILKDTQLSYFPDTHLVKIDRKADTFVNSWTVETYPQLRRLVDFFLEEIKPILEGKI